MGAGVKTCLAVNRPGALAGHHDRGGVLAGGVYETEGGGGDRHRASVFCGHGGTLGDALLAGHHVGHGRRRSREGGFGREEHGAGGAGQLVTSLTGYHDDRAVGIHSRPGWSLETGGRGVEQHERVTRGGHDGQGLRGCLLAGDDGGGGDGLHGAVAGRGIRLRDVAATGLGESDVRVLT